jgi:hypothetical protein
MGNARIGVRIHSFIHSRNVIEVWVFQEQNDIDLEDVQLSVAAWDQICYLIVLLHPYFVWTEITS